MIHRMDPPPTRGASRCRERVAPMLARLGELPPRRDALGLRDQVGRRARDRLRRAGRVRLAEPQPQRHHRRAIPEVRAPAAARSARASACSTARSSPSTRTAGPSFERLQRRMHVDRARRAVSGCRERMPVAYVIFDLLYLDGHSLIGPALRRAPRAARGARARGAGAGRPRAYHRGDGAALLDATREQGLEGVVAKRLDIAVRAGPPQRRLGQGQERPPPGVRDRRLAAGRGRPRGRVGALLVGYHERRRHAALRRAGRHRLHRGDARRPARAAARRWRATRSPFDGRAPPPPKGARFVEPRLRRRGRVPRVDARRHVRQPAYKGLRDDKPAEVVREDERRRREEASASVSGGDAREVDGRRAGELTAHRTCDKVLYPRRLHQGRRDRLLRAHRAGAAAPPARPAAHAQALPGRRRGRVTSTRSSARRTGPTGSQTASIYSSRERKTIDFCVATTCRRWCGWPTSPTSSCTRRSRSPRDIDAPDDGGLRPRPRAAGRRSSSAPRSRCGSRERVRAPRAAERSPRPPAPRACRSTCRSTPATSTYEHTKPFARAVAELLEKQQPELVVSRMTKAPARGQGARRLEPERRAQDDGLRLLAARARAARRSRRRSRGRRSRPRSPRATRTASSSRHRGVLARVAERGDPLRAALTTAPGAPRAVSVRPAQRAPAELSRMRRERRSRALRRHGCRHASQPPARRHRDVARGRWGAAAEAAARLARRAGRGVRAAARRQAVGTGDRRRTPARSRTARGTSSTTVRTRTPCAAASSSATRRSRAYRDSANERRRAPPSGSPQACLVRSAAEGRRTCRQKAVRRTRDGCWTAASSAHAAHQQWRITSADGNRQVVQRREGLRLHHARRGQPRPVRPSHGHQRRRLPLARRGRRRSPTRRSRATRARRRSTSRRSSRARRGPAPHRHLAKASARGPSVSLHPSVYDRTRDPRGSPSAS